MSERYDLVVIGSGPAGEKGAAQAAKYRKVDGYLIPLQNTTQQPDLSSLTQRETRQAIFESSWNRAEQGGSNDTRETLARMAQVRAKKAKLLGFPPGAVPGNFTLASMPGYAGFIEFICGILLILGLFTRPAAFIASTMRALSGGMRTPSRSQTNGR